MQQVDPDVFSVKINLGCGGRNRAELHYELLNLEAEGPSLPTNVEASMPIDRYVRWPRCDGAAQLHVGGRDKLGRIDVLVRIPPEMQGPPLPDPDLQALHEHQRMRQTECRYPRLFPPGVPGASGWVDEVMLPGGLRIGPDKGQVWYAYTCKRVLEGGDAGGNTYEQRGITYESQVTAKIRLRAGVLEEVSDIQDLQAVFPPDVTNGGRAIIGHLRGRIGPIRTV